MSPYLLLPLFALVAVIQTTLVPLLPTGDAKPDLFLVIVVAWGIVRGGGEATLWGLGGGLVLDVLSGVPFGLQTLGLGALGLLADLMETTFFRANILIPLAAILVATFIYHVLEAAAMQTLGYPIVWESFLTRVVLPTAIFNTLLMPFIFSALRRIHQRGHPRLTW
ncbi:MAG: rod shape-determining protein MreD [Anaerolineae bacterium]